ncbi:MAG: chemotaxis protein CheW [Desulfuromonadales bacterium]|nr:chemotaxis protein CheW [Desulfuromonadales bacterium]
MTVAEMMETTQFLTFSLADDIFAIDVIKAKEVLDFSEVTRVPQTPDYMLGVINLRGSVVPVIDMRRKFKMKDADRTRNSCIVVVEVDVDGEAVTVGALADSVREVIDLKSSQIEPPPRIGTRLNTEFIKGMGNLEERFVIILDIDKVFSVDDLVMAKTITEEMSEETETG